jgi:hypothetical protein
MNPELIRIDVRIAWAFASCYGVNLAFSVVGSGFFLQALQPCRFHKSGLVPLSHQPGSGQKPVLQCSLRHG